MGNFRMRRFANGAAGGTGRFQCTIGSGPPATNLIAWLMKNIKAMAKRQRFNEDRRRTAAEIELKPKKD